MVTPHTVIPIGVVATPTGAMVTPSLGHLPFVPDDGEEEASTQLGRRCEGTLGELLASMIHAHLQLEGRVAAGGREQEMDGRGGSEGRGGDGWKGRE